MSYADHYTFWNALDDKSIQKRKIHFEKILEIAGIENTCNTGLDIGCGDGVSLMAMQEYGILNAVGIDIDESQISNAIKLKQNAILVHSTEEFLKKNENTFDLVTMFDVLEHIKPENHIMLLESILKSLKPKGKILIVAPNANSIFASRYRYIDWTHHCSFTEHSINYVLRESGFKSIKVKEAEKSELSIKSFLKLNIIILILKRLFRLSRKLEAIAEFGFREGRRIPLSLNLLAVAEKDE